MIESPLIKELEAEFTHKATIEAMHKSILLVLKGRLGLVPEDVRAGVQRIQDEAALVSMTLLAARCMDLDEFRRNLPSVDAKA